MKRKISTALVLILVLMFLGVTGKVFAVDITIGTTEVPELTDTQTYYNENIYGGKVTVVNEEGIYKITLDNVKINEGAKIDVASDQVSGLIVKATQPVELTIKNNVVIGESTNYLDAGITTMGNLKIKGANENSKLEIHSLMNIVAVSLEFKDINLKGYSNKPVNDVLGNLMSHNTMKIIDSNIECESVNKVCIQTNILEINNSKVKTSISGTNKTASIIASGGFNMNSDSYIALAEINNAKIDNPKIDTVSVAGMPFYTIANDSKQPADKIIIKPKEIILKKEDSTEVKYEKLKEALEDALDGDVIDVLEENIEVIDELIIPENVTVNLKQGNKLKGIDLTVNGKLVLEDNAELVMDNLKGNGTIEYNFDKVSPKTKTLAKTLKIASANGYNPKDGDVILVLNAAGVNDPTMSIEELRNNLNLVGNYDDFNIIVNENNNATTTNYEVKLEAIVKNNTNDNTTNVDNSNNGNKADSKEETQENTTDKNEKDITPKTGNEMNYAMVSSILFIISLTGILYLNKKENK